MSSRVRRAALRCFSQEEQANAEATAAARKKKAAKRARRKERDAALKAVAEPLQAALSLCTDGGSAASCLSHAAHARARWACIEAAALLTPVGTSIAVNQGTAEDVRVANVAAEYEEDEHCQQDASNSTADNAPTQVRALTA